MRLFYYLNIFVIAVYSKLLPESCCLDKGVSSFCARKLCQPQKPPGDMERYTLFDHSRECQRFLPEIAECLSDGRDSSSCCTSEAERTDLGSCFSLCQGSASPATDRWARFKSCFILNVDRIYSCFQKSYATHPSPPRQLRIIAQTTTLVKLKWDVPLVNGPRVHIYKVHLVETSGSQHQEVLHDIKETELLINNLLPNKKYSVYVIAHGEQLEHKSLSSNLVHFTTSSETNINAVYKDEILVPRETNNVTLSCHLRQGVSKKKALIWEKQGTILDERRSSSKYSVTTYSKEVNGLLYYVSALQINHLVAEDFGVYKCHLESEVNDYGEVYLTEHSWSESTPPSNPPETPLECCSKSITRPHCGSICSNSVKTERHKDVKPGAFLPRFNCMPELQTLFQCTLKDVNNVGCCIQKKLPYHCLGMCDSRFATRGPMFSNCLSYLSDVHYCQAERMNVVPYIVSNVFARRGNDKTSLTWEDAEGAEVYHIYHRDDSKNWKVTTSREPSTTLPVQTNEIAIVAANKFGLSTAHRMTYENGSWSDSYL